MQNLIEYSDTYLKTSGSVWQYYRDEPFITNNWVVIDVPDDPDNASFKSKQKNSSSNRKWLNKSCTSKKLEAACFSNCRNKRLQFHDWWEKRFDQPVKNDLITFENIWNIATGQGGDYTTGCLLDYNYCKNIRW